MLDASQRSAHYLSNGAEVVIPGESLLRNYRYKHIDRLGWFEDYPNGNSLKYIDLYQIPNARNVYRATLRYGGWCETLSSMFDIGFFDASPRDLTGMTYRQLAASLMGVSPQEALGGVICSRLGIPTHSSVLKRLEWLGLLDDTPVSESSDSARMAVSHLMLEKLCYLPHERDLLVMQHELEVSYPDGTVECVESSLVDYGIPGKDSAIARTTGIPVALGCRFILNGPTLAGVHIPVRPEIYEWALPELERAGLTFKEMRRPISGGKIA